MVKILHRNGSRLAFDTMRTRINHWIRILCGSFRLLLLTEQFPNGLQHSGFTQLLEITSRITLIITKCMKTSITITIQNAYLSNVGQLHNINVIGELVTAQTDVENQCTLRGIGKWEEKDARQTSENGLIDIKSPVGGSQHSDACLIGGDEAVPETHEFGHERLHGLADGCASAVPMKDAKYSSITGMVQNETRQSYHIGKMFSEM